MSPCTIGKRHKWVFVRNQIRTTHMGSSVRLSKAGIYHCECGQYKAGAADINEVSE